MVYYFIAAKLLSTQQENCDFLFTYNPLFVDFNRVDIDVEILLFQNVVYKWG